ncbi:MAG: hypothetical protein KatS3mg129_1517 [Leptospiraceae bacterium]|nr:MAG: hypothetical protein KatS3mg129_1517 [Leptospiraceae bacterium]
MRLNHIIEQNRNLIIRPNRYNFLIISIILLIILMTPFVLSILLDIYTNLSKSDFISIFNDNFKTIVLLFYLICLIGLRSILIIRKNIPVKIVINSKQIIFTYKNKKQYTLSLQNLYYYVYKLSQNKNNYIGLYDPLLNIKIELFEGKENQISIIINYFKQYTNLKQYNSSKISIFSRANYKLVNVNSKESISEIHIKNKNRKYIISLLLVALVVSIFFIKFVLILNINIFKINDFSFDIYLIWDYIIILLIFLLFYGILIYSFINVFFDIVFKINDRNLNIYKRFFIFPLLTIKIKEFVIDENLILNLELYYDRKFSFIEIFISDIYKQKRLKFLSKYYYKISLFDYKINEAIEIYKNLCLFLKSKL